MKKILLLSIIILLGATRGYCQLMQSNSVGGSSKNYDFAPVAYLEKVPNKSDSIIKASGAKTDTAFKRLLGVIKDLQKIKAQSNTIDMLALKREDFRGKELDDLQSEINRLAASNKELENKLNVSGEEATKNKLLTQTLYGQINDLTIDKYEFYLKEIDGELKTYGDIINKNAKSALANFDTVALITDAQRQRIIDSLSNQMHLASYVINTKLDSAIKPIRNKVYNQVQELLQFKSDISRYGTSTNVAFIDTVYSRVIRVIENIKKSTDKYLAAKRSFDNDYEVYRLKFNSDLDKINAIIKGINKEEESSAKYVSALGGLNKVFGDNGTLTPLISVVAQKKFNETENGSFYGEVKIFTGGSSDDKTNNGSANLFVPEASTFGFMTDFSFGFISSNKSAKKNISTGRYDQRLGINLGVYYLGKKLQPDTLTHFNANVFHVKAGAQYILIPKVLSVYINTNCMLVSTNVNKFQQYYTDAKRVRSFTSFGIESYLDLNDVKDFHLLLNLGFVSVNDDVRAWTMNADSVIPSVKLSLVKTFNW